MSSKVLTDLWEDTDITLESLLKHELRCKL